MFSSIRVSSFSNIGALLCTVLRVLGIDSKQKGKGNGGQSPSKWSNPKLSYLWHWLTRELEHHNFVFFLLRFPNLVPCQKNWISTRFWFLSSLKLVWIAAIDKLNYKSWREVVEDTIFTKTLINPPSNSMSRKKLIIPSILLSNVLIFILLGFSAATEDEQKV